MLLGFLELCPANGSALVVPAEALLVTLTCNAPFREALPYHGRLEERRKSFESSARIGRL